MSWWRLCEQASTYFLLRDWARGSWTPCCWRGNPAGQSRDQPPPISPHPVYGFPYSRVIREGGYGGEITNVLVATKIILASQYWHSFLCNNGFFYYQRNNYGAHTYLQGQYPLYHFRHCVYADGSSRIVFVFWYGCMSWIISIQLAL